MIALLAGFFVATAAFLLARNAARFFQAESQISSAQFAAMMGMTRLQTDLQRAAFLSSPNVSKDPLRCGAMGDWPDGLKVLAGVTIENGGSVTRHSLDHALSTLNGLAPDALILGGSFNTTEQFAVRGIFPSGGGGLAIYLQTNDGAMARTLASATQGSFTLAQIFSVGRILRIVDDEGRQSYGVITAFTMVDPTTPLVSVASTPTVPSKADTGTCGYAGMSVGTLVNPVSRVLWDVRRVDPATYPQYAGLYIKGTHSLTPQHKGVAEAARTELVRVELDANGAELPTTLEVVAEYAVDFKLGLTHTGAPPYTTPALTRRPIGNAAVYTTAASPAAGGTPERIRAVQVRLTTRASERDRDLPIPAPGGGGIFRYNLGVNLGYARVRSLVADVALPNEMGASW